MDRYLRSNFYFRAPVCFYDSEEISSMARPRTLKSGGLIIVVVPASAGTWKNKERKPIPHLRTSVTPFADR